MVKDKIKDIAKDLAQELRWFNDVLKLKSELTAKKETKYTDIYELVPPSLKKSKSDFAQLIQEHNMEFPERFVLMLSIIPHIQPHVLDIFLQKNNFTQQNYTEFGGIKGKNFSGFLPTGETAMYVLSSDNLERRLSLYRLFDRDHPFKKNNILWLEEVEKGEPFLAGALTISREILDLITLGEERKPDFNSEFPAKLLNTNMTWDDLVLSHQTRKQFIEIEAWLDHHSKLMNDWGMSRKLSPGFKALFYGPPGTGKSLTSALMGKRTGRDVYRIDLSKVVSKYIGETEKNLAKIFDRAEHKDWILFFDEADALFGKRTSVQDAHDRYANQEVSYLLQRIETYNGLVILASNLKSNLDDAFLRRFQCIIHFPMPQQEERLQLWKLGFPEHCELESKVDLATIAKTYELAGGSIVNVLQYSMLMALNRGSNIVMNRDIIDGIKKEFQKAGRTV